MRIPSVILLALLMFPSASAIAEDGAEEAAADPRPCGGYLCIVYGTAYEARAIVLHILSPGDVEPLA